MKKIPLWITAGAVIGSAALLGATVSRPADKNAVESGAAVIAVTAALNPSSAIPVSAPAGSEFTITLPSNHTTGYRWRVGNTPNGRVVRNTSSTYNEPNTKMIGAGGTETWRFNAVGRGTTTVAMQYIRPWEKGVAPVRSQEFAITVR